MSKTKKTPAIRFNGFKGEWEEKKLGEIGSVVMNKRIFKHQTEEKGEIPFYKIGTFGGEPDAFISKSIFEDYKSKYPYPTKGDILISASGSIGKTVEYLGADEYFQDSNIVWLKHDGIAISNEYLKYFYSVVKWDGLEGSTIKRLYNSNILRTLISLPPLPEQTQIGNYFRELDGLIQLQEQKLEKVKNLKKAMLIKMFPTEGADVPEIRFKGFAEKWEKKKLDEIIDLKSGRDYKHLFPGNIPVYGTGGYMLSVNEALSYKENAIGIGRKGTIDKPYILRAPFWTVDTLFFALPKPNSDLDFIYSIFQRINWKQKDESTGVPSLSKNSINNIDIAVVSAVEQALIGNYFKNLDELIQSHEQKIEQLKHLKQALLQKMFI